MYTQCEIFLLFLPLRFYVKTTLLQSDPNQNFSLHMAVTLRLCISDPTLVKPKCVWEVALFLKNCKQTAEKFKQILNKKPCRFSKHFGFAIVRWEMHGFREICNFFYIRKKAPKIKSWWRNSDTYLSVILIPFQYGCHSKLAWTLL